jgi:hypothetical protein
MQPCVGGRFTNENGYALIANSIKVTRSVVLSSNVIESEALPPNCQATGCVSLTSATIGGNLDCMGGEFTNENGYALIANSIKVTGSVNLSSNFKATGCVGCN